MVESSSQRVDKNTWLSRREDAGNVVKLGIVKRTIIRRQQKLVLDSMRSSRLRER
jgi:hypothetical protein